MSDDKYIQTARQEFTRFLQSHNMRLTSERFAILDRVMRTGGHFTVEDFTGALETGGYHVSVATVYSTFRLLCEAGLLRRHTFAEGSAQFERNVAASSHTHLICTVCGKVREVRSADAGLAAQIERRKYTGFAPSHFALYIYGLCSRCQRASRQLKSTNSTTKK